MNRKLRKVKEESHTLSDITMKDKGEKKCIAEINKKQEAEMKSKQNKEEKMRSTEMTKN